MAKAKQEQELQEQPEVFGAKRVYDEWNVRIEGKQVKKTDISRSGITITEEQAEILNRGVVDGGNTHAKMYFPAE